MPHAWPVEFEWDLDKADRNLAEKKLDFEDAIGVFEGPTWDMPSINHRNIGKEAELRFLSTGIVNGDELTVVYTLRGRNYRIISARKAHPNERRLHRALIAWRGAQGAD
jgi:uncharacterized DUF497 family protein